MFVCREKKNDNKFSTFVFFCVQTFPLFLLPFKAVKALFCKFFFCMLWIISQQQQRTNCRTRAVFVGSGLVGQSFKWLESQSPALGWGGSYEHVSCTQTNKHFSVDGGSADFVVQEKLGHFSSERVNASECGKCLG